MPRFLRFNLFPLNVFVLDSEGRETKAHNASRVFVTDDEIISYVDGNSGPEVFFQDRLEDFSGDAVNGWTAQTSDGYTVNITRSTGCGCGSRLKGFNPFPGVPFERMLP